MTQTSKFDPRGPLPTKRGGAPRRPLNVLLSRYEVTPAGCWEWTGAKNGHGYGLLNMLIGQRQTTFAPHRLQWMHTHGEIPAGMVVMHVCDNRACVRPDHLVLGTQQANLADMRAKGRDNRSGLKNFGQSMADRYKWSA